MLFVHVEELGDHPLHGAHSSPRDRDRRRPRIRKRLASRTQATLVQRSSAGPLLVSEVKLSWHST